MTVSRIVGVEVKNRRRDRRNQLPLIELQLEGSSFSTRDWSLGGFLIENYKGLGLPGSVLSVTVIADIDGHVFRHQAECQLVRCDPATGELAARYTRLPPDAVNTLEGLQTGRLRRELNRKSRSAG